MRIEQVEVRDFRSYARATASLGRAVTVVHGPNGAGKSNLLEAVCFGCTARSPRTRNERELIAFGRSAARVALTLRDEQEHTHELSVGFGALGEGGRLEKRIRFDGASLQRIDDAPGRPLVSVFVPDRLELVAGGPSLRRAHMDNLAAALWPARANDRTEYSRALAQRNALLARIRSGSGSSSSLRSWDLELARHALVLSAGRAQAVERIAPGFAERCERLGLDGKATLEYCPAVAADSAEAVRGELQARLQADLDRGYTTHGPHRDELALLRDGRQLRAYGSQGERRVSLLCLLLAERAALQELRGTPPLMLLDDVMSELDERRRRLLIEELTSGTGQSVIAATELSHVPGSRSGEMDLLDVDRGGQLEPVRAGR
jgi:DNA replication and repair protein RecF